MAKHRRSGHRPTGSPASGALTDRLGMIAWIVVGIALLVGAVFGFQALRADVKGQAPPTHHPVTLGDRAFNLELALTPEKRKTGLMNRSNLPDDGGMLFVFPASQVQDFWMKNCLIALDIIFINEARQIVSIHTLPPPPPGTPDRDVPSCTSAGPAIYVIELEGGTAEQLGLTSGSQLNLQVDSLKRWVR